jgi:Tfp pilus assembly protein PilZ
MNNKEKRKDIRLDLSDPCFVMIKDELHEVYNISKNGLFLTCDINKFKIGEKILIEMLLPDSLGSMNIECKVIRFRWYDKDKNKIGAGLEFINMKSKTSIIINSYVAYLRNKQIIKVARMIIKDYFGKNTNDIKI